MGLGIEHFAFSKPSPESRGNSTTSPSSRRLRILLMEKEFRLGDCELFAKSMSEQFTGSACEAWAVDLSHFAPRHKVSTLSMPKT